MFRPARPSEPFLLALAVLLALLHAVLGVTGTAGKSITHDEIAHLTAGYVHNTLNDYRLQPENGNLPQRWAALPLLALDAQLPERTGDEAWARSDVWNYGHQFFYRSGNSTDLMLFAGRAMISLFSAGTGLLIFLWSRRLFGVKAGFLSLALFAFCPNFLAHGPLATSDVTMVFFLVLSVTTWWWLCEQPSWRRTAVSAVVFALACVAKYSAVLLLPMMALLALLALLQTRELRLPRAGAIGLAGLVHFAAAWAVIWLFFGARYSAFNPELPAALAGFNRPWEWFSSSSGLVPTVIAWARDVRLLPEGYLYGFLFVSEFAQQRGAFLSGDYSIHGWTSFFPLAFLIKTPLPVLILTVGALTAWLIDLSRTGRDWARAARQSLLSAAPLLVLFAVYATVSITSRLNIGHRHILPLYPVLFIWIGSLVRWLEPRRVLPWLLLGGLLTWQVAESLRIRPHYLAYFNQLVGGPAHGHEHLVDSSLDWGQDLPGLAQWLAAHNQGAAAVPVYLAYFGTGDPAYEGIAARRLPSLPQLPPPPRWVPLEPGLYCVSATMLQQVYSPVRGPWTPENERDYRKLRELESLLLTYQDSPDERRRLQRDLTDQEWRAAWKRYDLLRFARLCHYLRAVPPEAVIGHSISVYRLSAAEVRTVVQGTGADLGAAIERAVAKRAAR